MKALPSKIIRYGYGILGLRKNDILLASFPRVGSTWIRFILANVISINELHYPEINYRLVDQLLPSLGRSNLIKPWPYKTLPRIIKTHQPYWPIFLTRPNRCVYIQRDPRDVMVSYYHYRQNLKVNTFRGSFSKFIRHPKYGLKFYFRHYLSWRTHTTFQLSYEKMLKDPDSEIKNMLNSLGLNILDDIVSRAIQKSTLREMQNQQNKSGLRDNQRLINPMKLVARKGKHKQWVDYFSLKDISYFETVSSQFDLI